MTQGLDGTDPGSSTRALHDAVRTSDLLLTCGPGGVGKTTTAAALGMAAARAGRRTVVMTVDPARRLAEALGLGAGAVLDEPHRVGGVAVDAAGGELYALMLDAEKTFDRLVHDQAGGQRQAEAILSNPVYRAIAGSLSGAQEYMAIERLHQLHTSGHWDLVIVDTPPSRHAIDLLEAPDRLVAFLGHPVYRALTVGQRTFARITDAASSMFLWAVKRLAGPQIVEDTIRFFRSLANIEGGLRRRAQEVSTLLRSDGTTFVVVSSPRREAVDEAEHLLHAVADRKFALGGVVINLVHPLPPPLPDEVAAELTTAIGDDAGALRDHLDWYGELSALAASERREMERLVRLAGDAPRVELPILDVDVHDLNGLDTLSARLA